jgi:hypothetical protein
MKLEEEAEEAVKGVVFDEVLKSRSACSSSNPERRGL